MTRERPKFEMGQEVIVEVAVEEGSLLLHRYKRAWVHHDNWVNSGSAVWLYIEGDPEMRPFHWTRVQAIEGDQ